MLLPVKIGVHFGEMVKNRNICIKESAMPTADNIRNSIIDKLLTISNKDYLSALHQLIEKSSVSTDIVKLSEEQVLMLKLSDKDIENNRLISQDDLDIADLKWLKEL